MAYDLPRVHLRLCSPHRTVRPAVRRVCGQEQEAEDCKGGLGYLAASATSTLPVVLTVAALVCLALRQFAGSKLPAVVNDMLLVAANVCLIGSFAVFVLARVSLAADVYFIPVNYPASEATALHISIVGAVCYLVGIVTLIVEGFSAKN